MFRKKLMSDGGSGTTHLFCTVSSHPTSPAKTTCPPPPIDTKRPLPAADSASVLSTKASDADLMCLCTNKQVSAGKIHQHLFIMFSAMLKCVLNFFCRLLAREV